MITILDGGMGRELQRVGAPFRQPEWSAQALIEAPHYVSQVHRNFIKAGAEIITTNTYALVPFHLGQQRLLREEPQRASRGAACGGVVPRYAVRTMARGWYAAHVQ